MAPRLAWTLLRAIVRPRDASVVRLIAAALSADDWRALPSLAQRHRLAPVAHSRLLAAGAVLPTEVERALLAERAAQSFHASHRRERLERLGDDLAPLGVPIVLYKGASYAFHLYPEAGLRPMGDVDLLVRGEDGATVAARLLDVGFARGPRYPRFTHEQSFFRAPFDNVDLHTAFIQRERNAIDYDAVIARAVPSVLHPALRRLDAIDEILAHAIHQAVHELAVDGITFVDLALLAERAEGDAGELWRRARAAHVARMLAAASALGAREFALAVPGAEDAPRPRPFTLPPSSAVAAHHEAARPLQLARKALLFDRPRELAHFALAQGWILLGRSREGA